MDVVTWSQYLDKGGRFLPLISKIEKSIFLSHVKQFLEANAFQQTTSILEYESAFLGYGSLDKLNSFISSTGNYGKFSEADSVGGIQTLKSTSTGNETWVNTDRSSQHADLFHQIEQPPPSTKRKYLTYNKSSSTDFEENQGTLFENRRTTAESVSRRNLGSYGSKRRSLLDHNVVKKPRRDSSNITPCLTKCCHCPAPTSELVGAEKVVMEKPSVDLFFNKDCKCSGGHKNETTTDGRKPSRPSYTEDSKYNDLLDKYLKLQAEYAKLRVVKRVSTLDEKEHSTKSTSELFLQPIDSRLLEGENVRKSYTVQVLDSNEHIPISHETESVGCTCRSPIGVHAIRETKQSVSNDALESPGVSDETTVPVSNDLADNTKYLPEARSQTPLESDLSLDHLVTTTENISLTPLFTPAVNKSIQTPKLSTDSGESSYGRICLKKHGLHSSNFSFDSKAYKKANVVFESKKPSAMTDNHPIATIIETETPVKDGSVKCNINSASNHASSVNDRNKRDFMFQLDSSSKVPKPNPNIGQDNNATDDLVPPKTQEVLSCSSPTTTDLSSQEESMTRAIPVSPILLKRRSTVDKHPLGGQSGALILKAKKRTRVSHEDDGAVPVRPSNSQMSLLSSVKVGEPGVVSSPTSKNGSIDDVEFFTGTLTDENYFPLDFNRVVTDMKTGPMLIKLKLLQALRWRLTHASSVEIRDKVINSYVHNDILCLFDSTSNTQRSCSTLFLTRLYFPSGFTTPHPIQQAIARLVNAIASLSIGRDYLTKDTSLVENIFIRIVLKEPRYDLLFDTATEEMAIATLQKLSLRNNQRLYMISAGLVEHIIKSIIRKLNKISMYQLQYETALLMNLCLHREAGIRCSQMLPTLVEFFIMLLDSRYTECLLYVNRTMYSLLMHPKILEVVQNAGIASVIRIRIKQVNKDLKLQLDFLYRILTDHNFAKSKCLCEPTNEPDDEIDLIEPELDENDTTLDGRYDENKQSRGEFFLRHYMRGLKDFKVSNDPIIAFMFNPSPPKTKNQQTQLGSGRQQLDGSLGPVNNYEPHRFVSIRSPSATSIRVVQAATSPIEVSILSARNSVASPPKLRNGPKGSLKYTPSTISPLQSKSRTVIKPDEKIRKALTDVIYTSSSTTIITPVKRRPSVYHSVTVTVSPAVPHTNGTLAEGARRRESQDQNQSTSTLDLVELQQKISGSKTSYGVNVNCCGRPLNDSRRTIYPRCKKNCSCSCNQPLPQCSEDFTVSPIPIPSKINDLPRIVKELSENIFEAYHDPRDLICKRDRSAGDSNGSMLFCTECRSVSAESQFRISKEVPELPYSDDRTCIPDNIFAPSPTHILCPYKVKRPKKRSVAHFDDRSHFFPKGALDENKISKKERATSISNSELQVDCCASCEEVEQVDEVRISDYKLPRLKKNLKSLCKCVGVDLDQSPLERSTMTLKDRNQEAVTDLSHSSEAKNIESGPGLDTNFLSHINYFQPVSRRKQTPYLPSLPAKFDSKTQLSRTLPISIPPSTGTESISENIKVFKTVSTEEMSLASAVRANLVYFPDIHSITFLSKSTSTNHLIETQSTGCTTSPSLFQIKSSPTNSLASKWPSKHESDEVATISGENKIDDVIAYAGEEMKEIKLPTKQEVSYSIGSEKQAQLLGKRSELMNMDLMMTDVPQNEEKVLSDIDNRGNLNPPRPHSLGKEKSLSFSMLKTLKEGKSVEPSEMAHSTLIKCACLNLNHPEKQTNDSLTEAVSQNQRVSRSIDSTDATQSKLENKIVPSNQTQKSGARKRSCNPGLAYWEPTGQYYNRPTKKEIFPKKTPSKYPPSFTRAVPLGTNPTTGSAPNKVNKGDPFFRVAPTKCQPVSKPPVYCPPLPKKPNVCCVQFPPKPNCCVSTRACNRIHMQHQHCCSDPKSRMTGGCDELRGTSNAIQKKSAESILKPSSSENLKTLYTGNESVETILNYPFFPKKPYDFFSKSAQVPSPCYHKISDYQEKMRCKDQSSSKIEHVVMNESKHTSITSLGNRGGPSVQSKNKAVKMGTANKSMETDACAQIQCMNCMDEEFMDTNESSSCCKCDGTCKKNISSTTVNIRR